MEYAHTTGIVSGLMAALTWAIASIMFRKLGVSIRPLILNVYKGVVSIGILLAVLVCRGGLLPEVPLRPLCLLLASGVIGIGIGDTALFASLNRLGERQTILIAQSAAPVATVLIAVALLGEQLPAAAFIGIGAIVAGVLWVVAERPQLPTVAGTGKLPGILYGVVAALCQALGAVLSKAAFREYDITPMWSALIRLVGGTAVVLLLIPFSRQPLIPRSLRNGRVWRMVLIASSLGTFGAITFQQMAFKYTYTAVAQTVIAMSVIFVMIAARLRGERSSARAWIGAALAVAGVCLLFLAKDAPI